MLFYQLSDQCPAPELVVVQTNWPVDLISGGTNKIIRRLSYFIWPNHPSCESDEPQTVWVRLHFQLPHHVHFLDALTTIYSIDSNSFVLNLIQVKLDFSASSLAARTSSHDHSFNVFASSRSQNTWSSFELLNPPLDDIWDFKYIHVQSWVLDHVILLLKYTFNPQSLVVSYFHPYCGISGSHAFWACIKD